MPAELYLLLAMMSSAAVAIVLKKVQSESRNRYSVILGNYLTCVVIAFVLLPDRTVFGRTEGAALGCGVIGGILFVAGMVSMQSSIRVNGAILTSAFAKLGLIVPLLVSMVFLGERPLALQIPGLVLALYALWIISGRSSDDASGRSKARTKEGADARCAAQQGRQGVPEMKKLLAVLLACGCADTMARIFEQAGSREQDELYIFYVFAAAALLTALLLYREYRSSGAGISAGDLLAGAAVGIPNYFSAALFLKALEGLPALIAYPAFSTGSIFLVTVVSLAVFGERPKKSQWIGLGLIVISLVLLGTGR